MNRPVAFITGARRGIGKAISVSLAKKGFDLYLSDKVIDDDARQTREIVQSLGARVEFKELDISDLNCHGPAFEDACRRFGKVDCLVNNAGIGAPSRGDMLEVSEENFDQLIAVNLKGAFFLTQQAGRYFSKFPKQDHPRSIVNVSSISAISASITRAEYCISKSAIPMSTKLFALRLAEYDVAVFEVRPGIIRTDMTREVTALYDELIAKGISPIKRWGEPEDVGRAVAGLASGDFEFGTGSVIYADGGMHIQRL